MSSEIAISVQNISKMYPMYANPQDRLKQAMWNTVMPKLGQPYRQLYKEFWALRDVSFEIKKGETVGIIGRNGSGKSTLLQIIAGTLAPTGGEVQVNGRVAALLELGSGFNPEFTGRENVYLNGSILGFSREGMDERFDEIAAFADIGQFIDQPVKLYSSGMFVRLAFAVQACVEPDVLIVDEALSVGDVFFQQKCHTRMDAMLSSNTAIILVSHDMRAIEKYSNHVLLLDQGEPHFLGQPNEAVQRYYQLNHSTSKLRPISMQAQPNTHKETFSFGSDTISDWPDNNSFIDLSGATITGNQDIATCTGVALCNEKGIAQSSFQINDLAFFYYEFELMQDIGVPIGGVEIIHKMNLTIHGKNSLQYFVNAPPTLKKGAIIRFRQTVKLAVAPSEYVFAIGLATINADDYTTVTNTEYSHLVKGIQEIMRVTQIGIISVEMKKHGQSLPFHGYADLAGSCTLSILTDC